VDILIFIKNVHCLQNRAHAPAAAPNGKKHIAPAPLKQAEPATNHVAGSTRKSRFRLEIIVQPRSEFEWAVADPVRTAEAE
jgi:hypothetical protein